MTFGFIAVKYNRTCKGSMFCRLEAPQPGHKSNKDQRPQKEHLRILSVAIEGTPCPTTLQRITELPGLAGAYSQTYMGVSKKCESCWGGEGGGAALTKDSAILGC